MTRRSTENYLVDERNRLEKLINLGGVKKFEFEIVPNDDVKELLFYDSNMKKGDDRLLVDPVGNKIRIMSEFDH